MVKYQIITPDFRSILCVLMITWVTTSSHVNAQWQNLHDEIERSIRLESGIDFNLVPGLVVGVWDRDSIYYFTFGQGVAVEDIFELGSLSKPITAFLAARAIHTLQSERPEIPLHLCNFLPELSGSWCELTFDLILEHKTGLPKDISLVRFSSNDPEVTYHNLDTQELLHYLSVMQPIPGRYAYSHLGYAVLNRLFLVVGGLDGFSKDVLEAELGLKGMRWDVPDSMLTQGYGFDGKPAQPWHVNALKPALGLRSDIKSMMQWLILESPGMEYREAPSMRMMKKDIALHARLDSYKVLDGWFLIRSGKSVIRYHTGRTGGHQTSVAFIPSLNKGVAVFSNGAAGSNELCFSILTMLRRNKVKKVKESNTTKEIETNDR